MNITPRTHRSKIRWSKRDANQSGRRNRVYLTKRSKRKKSGGKGFERFWNNLKPLLWLYCVYSKRNRIIFNGLGYLIKGETLEFGFGWGLLWNFGFLLFSAFFNFFYDLSHWLNYQFERVSKGNKRRARDVWRILIASRNIYKYYSTLGRRIPSLSCGQGFFYEKIYELGLLWASSMILGFSLCLLSFYDACMYDGCW